MGKIAIIDPSLLDRKRIRNVLEAVGHDVMEAESPEEALETIRSLPPGSVKLILSELQFPAEEGKGFLERYASEPLLTGVPVIIVTPRPSRETVVRLISAGIATVVTKPFSGEVLLRRVTETLREVKHLSQGVGEQVSWSVQDFVRREVKRAQRSGSPLSVVLVRVLDLMNGQGVPLLMRGLLRNMRESDVLARLGDERVVILLPDTDAAGAAVVERRVWETARSGLDLPVTVRVGRATYPTEAGSADALLKVADDRAR